jgi:hypothetical protein
MPTTSAYRILYTLTITNIAMVQNFEIFTKFNIFRVCTIENHAENVSLNCIIITVILINLNTHDTHEGYEAKQAMLSAFENILPCIFNKIWGNN